MSGGMSVGGIKLCTKSNQLIKRQSQSISPSVLLIMKTKTRAGVEAEGRLSRDLEEGFMDDSDEEEVHGHGQGHR